MLVSCNHAANARLILELFSRETKKGCECWGDQVSILSFLDRLVAVAAVAARSAEMRARGRNVDP
jgi:N6-adenosine-specific RNA methylase IME4